MVAALPSLSELVATHFEWLAVYSEGRTFPLRVDEIEIDQSPDRTLIGMHGERGFRTWRVHDIGCEDGEILLSLSRRLGAVRQTVRLIPRTSAAELAGEVELARLMRANDIARLVETNFPDLRIARVGLNESNGRMANIIAESPEKDQTAVVADVTNVLTAENMLASALLWLERLNARRKKAPHTVWMVAEKKQARALRRLHTLLNKNARSRVVIMEISDEKLRPLDEWTLSSLWREKPQKLSIPSEVRVSKTLAEIIDIDPDSIDSLRSKQGETARFHGLPFARVRTLMGS